MTTTSIILVLVLVMYLWWAIQVLFPPKTETRKIIAILVLIVSILMLLWAFGVIPLFHLVR
jgi:hypothetical protein